MNNSHLKLNTKSKSVTPIYEEVLAQVEAHFARLEVSGIYTPREICGKAYWDTLPLFKQSLAAQSISSLAEHNVLPLHKVNISEETQDSFQVLGQLNDSWYAANSVYPLVD